MDENDIFSHDELQAFFEYQALYSEMLATQNAILQAELAELPLENEIQELREYALLQNELQNAPQYNPFAQILENAYQDSYQAYCGAERQYKHDQFLSLAEERKWPVFFINDETFETEFIDACSTGADNSEICSLVNHFFRTKYLKDISNRWESSPAIDSNRKPILKEALELFETGAYYAVASILMCQVYGVVHDCNQIVKKKKLSITPEQTESLCKYFSIKKEVFEKQGDKIQLFQKYCFTHFPILTWKAVFDYLKEEIVCSSDSKARWATQPLRNKICHGLQLNFGTVEHALKAIFAIELLVRIAEEIYYIEPQQ